MIYRPFSPCRSGLLCLCARRRCQPGVLHDPGTHLPHELVGDDQPPRQPTRRPYLSSDQRMTIVTMTADDKKVKKFTSVIAARRKQTTDWTVPMKKKLGCGLVCGWGRGAAFCSCPLSVLVNYITTTETPLPPPSLRVFPSPDPLSRSPSSPPSGSVAR